MSIKSANLIHRTDWHRQSWLACALAQKACRDGFSVLHKRTTELFRELAVAHIDGSIGRVLVKLSRVDVLVLDDFAMAPLKDGERRDFLEICHDRYQHLWVIKKSLRASFTLLPTSGNDDEEHRAGMWTRFGFGIENAFRRLVRQECSCSGRCEFGLDGSKQRSRAQAGEDDTR